MWKNSNRGSWEGPRVGGIDVPEPTECPRKLPQQQVGGGAVGQDKMLKDLDVRRSQNNDKQSAVSNGGKTAFSLLR